MHLVRLGKDLKSVAEKLNWNLTRPLARQQFNEFFLMERQLPICILDIAYHI